METVGIEYKVIILSQEIDGSTLPIFFTPSQANELLPEIEKTVVKIIGFKKDTERLNENDNGMREVMESLQREIQRLEDLGCVLKDPNIGLVDFPAVRLGVRVWLCWKLGDNVVGFWHGLHDGFAGRKPVKDAEFYQDDLAIKTLTGNVSKSAD